MAELHVTFDGALSVKSGEVITILRGIRKGDSIRASLIQTSSMVKQRIQIDGTRMTEVPVDLTPPIVGKVIGVIDMTRSGTTFKIKEVSIASKPRRKKWSRYEEKAIWEKYEHRCAICQKATGFDEGVIDHIQPLAKGGSNDFENLQWLCLRCNKLKGHRKTNDDVKKILAGREH